DFYCDGGVLVGSATVSPYSVPCNTATMANGSHSFYAKAYDAANNSATSASTTVNVSNVASTGGQPQWVRDVPGMAVSPAATAIDHVNNMVTVGYFSGSADFGAGALPSAGGSDIFIAKYTSQNSLLWAKRFGGGGYDNAYSVAVDSQNNIIVAGCFTGS